MFQYTYEGKTYLLENDSEILALNLVSDLMKQKSLNNKQFEYIEEIKSRLEIDKDHNLLMAKITSKEKDKRFYLGMATAISNINILLDEYLNIFKK
jgi:hypothetical protein